jgi:hypothetical protein
MTGAARALYAILALTPAATHAALAAFLQGYHAVATMEESADAALEICLLCDAKVNGARAGQSYSAWHAANLARTHRLMERVGVSAAHAENMTALFESVCTGLLCADIFLLAIQNNNK